MKFFLVLTFIFFLKLIVVAQNERIVFSGFVKDISTHEALMEVGVFSLPSKTMVRTNEYGFFSIGVPIDDTILVLRNVGYDEQQIPYDKLDLSSKLNIFMKSSFQTFEEIIVSANDLEKDVTKNELGIVTIPIEEMRLLPNFFGEVDVVKSYQLMPGIESGGENSSGFFVRGGGADQNLILLDDVPLYNVSHLGGFFSIFNSDIVRNSSITKSGFPARHGGRMSSVLDVRMREGSSKGYQFQGALGLMSGRLAIEGPLINNKSSFVVSGRSSLLPIFKLLGMGLNYNFNDLNAKVNYKISDNDNLYFSFYRGKDRMSIRNKSKEIDMRSSIAWGNTMYALRWNRTYGSKLFSNLVVYNTSYFYDEDFNFNRNTDSSSMLTENSLTTGVRDLGVKMDFSYFFNDKIKFRFGGTSVFHSFIPNNTIYRQSGSDFNTFESSYVSDISVLENAFYVENEMNFDKISFNIGARVVNYIFDNQYENFIEPRAVLSYNFRKGSSIKYSSTVMNQFAHLLNYSGLGMPSDYWMPSTKNVPPSTSIQHAIGFYQVFNNKYVLSIEGYGKNSNNMIAFKPGESLIGITESFENIIETNGTNTAYGAELMLQKKTGKTTGWLSFSYARSLMSFENLNNGEAFPFKYDRPININLVIIHKLNEKINLSAAWVYGTGYPVTLPTEYYTYNDKTIFTYSEINGVRMRDFHRLDVSLTHTKKLEKGERIWSFSIFNLYNRQNPLYYYLQNDVENSVVVIGGPGIENQKEVLPFKVYQQSLFPFFPSFSYSFKFK